MKSGKSGRRPAARSFLDLTVWQKAPGFVPGVYRLTAGFRRAETYGLAIQMRRAAMSIAANLAEGFRQRGRADKARFMNIAEGSLEECRCSLIPSSDLGYDQTEALTQNLEDVSRLLGAYTAAILTSDS